MKSLNEEINEIVNSKSSKTLKHQSLVKLGLRPYEVTMILGSIRTEKKFNADSMTFGVEIECYNCNRTTLIEAVGRRSMMIQSECYNHTDNESYYKIVSDGSIHGHDGNEVVSPILKGNQGLDSLRTVCEALNEVGAMVNKSTGLHIHFGLKGVKDTHYSRIITNYQKLESVIDSFMPLSRRGNNNGYCKSLVDKDFSRCAAMRDFNAVCCGDRYYKVNTTSYTRHGTLEFRQHSGTTDYEKIKMWIQFLRKLIAFSFNKEIQECASIDEIPFLNATEKSFFNDRKNQLA